MANNYDIGDLVRMSAAFTTTSGSAADPTGLTFKLKDTTGSTATYVYGTDAALVKDSTGNYHVDYAPAAAGNYYYRFAGTGAVQAAGEELFSVRESEFS